MKKIIINRQILLNHLKHGVTTVIQANSITPAMECIFLKKVGSEITFQCSNNEMDLISTMYQEEGDDMAVAIQCDIFFSTLNSLKSETVELRSVNDKQFILISDKKKYTIPAFFSTEFPYVPVNKDLLKGIHVPGDLVCKYTEKALTAIDRKSMSPVFACVELKTKDNNMSITGASSFFMYQCKFNNDSEDINVYLIPKVADTLLSIAPKETIFVGTDGKKTVIRIGNMTINAVSMADKKYVDISPFFDIKREATILFNRNETLESLKRIQNYSGKDNDFCIKKENDEYVFICQDMMAGKRAQEVVDVETSDDVTCGINVKSLRSCFNNIDSETVKIQFGSKINIPMLIEPLGDFSVREVFILGQCHVPEYVK